MKKCVFHAKVRHILIIAVIVLVMGVSLMLFMGTKIKTDTNKITLPSIDNVPKEHWEKLAQKKIYFGHHSVGNNILDGINALLNEHEYVTLNVVKTDNLTDFDAPIFAHSSVGRNLDPNSKMEDFRDIMDSGIGEKIDIAFFKFCFVDVRREANPRGIFSRYRDLMEDLESRYPDTEFIHVTVPLTSPPRKAKARLKEIVKVFIGKPKTGDMEANLKRQRYNLLLADTYSETGNVFDLALIESVNPSGFKSYFEKNREKISVLAPEYTNDGGHLIDQGKKTLAEQLLIALAGVANKL